MHISYSEASSDRKSFSTIQSLEVPIEAWQDFREAGQTQILLPQDEAQGPHGPGTLLIKSEDLGLLMWPTSLSPHLWPKLDNIAQAHVTSG